MDKVKYELEIPIHASPNMLYQYISSPSNLQEWFADKVNSRGKIFSFIWDGLEEKAKLLLKKSEDRIRFKWLESEDDESFFEIRIQVDALTKDVSLIITDFADDEDEVEESKQLWQNQIDELKHTIGA
ncbi:MAG: START-like domain-containing protein [Polaribacter sp.]|uniref:START-like domain-containing protein n=1 Tax=Polaribacter sp. TaxID=1920175 RepID=UPI003BAEF6E7